jgi:putative serine protease PepD
VSRSEWDDDEQYEVAPLPAHERVWRHPSEMGEQAWLHSEPPLAIGRGLTMATGTIGCVLALAVLWTMLPTQAGRSANSSVRATSALRTDDTVATLQAGVSSITEADAPVVTASSPLSSGAITAVPQQTSAVATTVAPQLTYQVQQGTEVSEVAIAVAVHGGSLVVTTAQAVTADHTVDLMLPDGSIAAAQVLFVDDRSGLAVLAPHTASGTMAFVVAAGIESGDELTFLGLDAERTVTVPDDLTVAADWLDGEPTVEGAPVVNQRGELVALCSHNDAGETRLVRLDNLDQLQQALRSFSGTAPVWLGVVLNDDPSGKLSIGAIDPAGPAALAGLTSGDVIVSIDGTLLASGQALTDALAQHAPGDLVEFVVRRADGTEVTVSVTLAAPKTAV